MKRDKDIIYEKGFRFFSQFILTRRQTRNLYRRFQVISPGDRKSIVKKSMKCALLMWGLEAIAMLLVLSLNPSVFGIACSVLAIYVVSGEVVNRMETSAQIRLLEGLDSFLSDVRHNYYNYRMVEEAVYEASRQASDMMKPQAEKLGQVLEADDIHEALSRYNDEVSDRFLRMFLALCVTVLEYGDKEVDGQLLFLNNIKYLKQEIAVELLKRKELKYRFSGLIWIAVLPVFFLPAVESWAVGNLPSLTEFYRGAGGIILSAVIYLATWIIYMMLNQLKERDSTVPKEHKMLKKLLRLPIAGLLDNYISKNYGKCKMLTELLRKVGDTRSIREYLLFRFLTAGAAALGCMLLFAGIHREEKRQAFYVSEGTELVSGAANKTQQLRMEEMLPTLLEQYIGTGIGEEEILQEIKAQGILNNSILAEDYAKEVYERVRKYDRAYFKWYELGAAVLVGLAAYELSYGFLLYRKKLMQMEMEDEVVQFQSIILMMMYMDRMNIPAIFEMLENFAVVFKIPLQKCMNNYNYGDMLALRELREECGFEPMRRLVDQFLLCDRIGIIHAFDEIAVERANFREKRKLDNEMNLSRRTAVGNLISYVPMALTVGGYLIIPFIRESLAELMQYAGEMNAM